MEIVKVEVVIGGRALVYPRECAGGPIDKQADRRMKDQKLDEASLRALNGDRQMYCKASWVEGRWKLGRRLPDQRW